VKPTNISELKTVLKAIWSDLPQGPIDEALLSFRKRLQACIKAAGGHFEHALYTDVCNINISLSFAIKTFIISSDYRVTGVVVH